MVNRATFMCLSATTRLTIGDENPKYVDGYYCGFRDATTGKCAKRTASYFRKRYKRA